MLTAVLSGILLCPAPAPQEKAPPPAPVTVTLNRQALVPGHEILLGDIARITVSDADQRRLLEQTVIGPTPKGSWVRRVEAAEVRRLLEARGVARAGLVLNGDPIVEVLAATERVTPEEIVQAAETVLRAMLTDEGESDATWTLSRKPSYALVPAARKGRELVARLTSGKLLASSALLNVDIKIDDEVVHTASLPFVLQRYREVLVTQREVKKGEVLDGDAIARRRMNIAGLMIEPLIDAEQLVGRVAARDLRRDALLTDSDLRLPALVRRSQEVTVVALAGNVRIATKGVALQDGARGETIAIHVTSDRNKPPIYAEVYGPGLAVIRHLRPDLPSTPDRLDAGR